jgi:hypothetical protein
MIDFQDMTFAITTISGLQCTKIARTLVVTTEIWDSTTTSIEIQFWSELPVTTITAQPGSSTAGGDSVSGPSKTLDLTTTATYISTAYGEGFLYCIERMELTLTLKRSLRYNHLYNREQVELGLIPYARTCRDCSQFDGRKFT